MPSLLPRPTRLSVTRTPFLVFLVTLGLCLLRAADLPSVDIGVGGTTRLDRPGRPRAARSRPCSRRASSGAAARCRRPGCWRAIGAFALLIVVSAIPNGGRRRHRGGQAVRLRRRSRSAPPRSSTRGSDSPTLAAFLVAFCTVAVAWGAVEFVGGGGRRQGSFLGEHDLAALSTMALVLGLAYALRPRPPAGRRCALVGDRRRRGRDRPRRLAGEPARPLPRGGGDGRRSRSCAATCAAAPSSSRC